MQANVLPAIAGGAAVVGVGVGSYCYFDEDNCSGEVDYVTDQI